METFVGRVWAKAGLIIGGVKQNTSTPFATRQDARSWMLTVLQANKDAGCDVEGETLTLWNGKIVERR